MKRLVSYLIMFLLLSSVAIALAPSWRADTNWSKVFKTVDQQLRRREANKEIDLFLAKYNDKTKILVTDQEYLVALDGIIRILLRERSYELYLQQRISRSADPFIDP